MKRPQSIVFGICLRCLIVSCLLSSIAWAGERNAPDATITVLVYNYAHASAATLAGAEGEAGRILSEAGVRTVWLECPVGQSTASPQKLCQKAFEATDIKLRVLAAPIRNQFQLGFAIHPVFASVYYEYAVNLANSDVVAIRLPTILGCAMAHEVGHLLLGPNNHSIAGIMQGEWKSEQLRQALKGWLLFNHRQSKVIQTEARRRMRLQTGILKGQRLAAVDQQDEPRVIPQSD